MSKMFPLTLCEADPLESGFSSGHKVALFCVGVGGGWTGNFIL